MPLPPALAAKLAKRGLLKKNIPDTEQVEEVFAENYDDPSQVVSKKRLVDFVAPETDRGSTIMNSNTEEEDVASYGVEVIHLTTACPNLSNPYHVCSDYCAKKWGNKKFKPDTRMITKKEKMLLKYPIPDGWMEVGDPNTGRYYYWNMQTDEVSWLPPSHPKASISLSSERLKELSSSNVWKNKRKRVRDSQGESSGEESKSDQSDVEEPEPKIVVKEGGKKKRVVDELDPMDPAAYSDVPVGTWTTGLDQRGSAKTGVDVTASGPLFQQRPYPSPGAVLRLNKNSKK